MTAGFSFLFTAFALGAFDTIRAVAPAIGVTARELRARLQTRAEARIARPRRCTRDHEGAASTPVK